MNKTVSSCWWSLLTIFQKTNATTVISKWSAFNISKADNISYENALQKATSKNCKLEIARNLIEATS